MSPVKYELGFIVTAVKTLNLIYTARVGVYNYKFDGGIALLLSENVGLN
jgi:hypothetical protein